MRVKEGYDYDDVLLVPKQSNINSRSDVNLFSDWCGYFPTEWEGIYPIISAPMKYISGVKLVKEMGRINCLGIYHRFHSRQQRFTDIQTLGETGYLFGVAVGVADLHGELGMAQYAVDNNCSLICVDVANGHLDRVVEFVKELRNIIPEDTSIMAGNVATLEGANTLYNAGANFIRVGIGGGALCTTRNVTGIGVPQLTAVEECARVNYKVEGYYGVTYINGNLTPNYYQYRNVYAHKCFIVSDGGIKNSGNAVKSFAVGAEFVMLGSVLANSLEAENNGTIMGMASREIQENYSTVKSIEGMELKLTKEKRPLEEIINEFLWGIRSACTYLNCSSYKDIKNNAEFISTGRGTLKDV